MFDAGWKMHKTPFSPEKLLIGAQKSSSLQRSSWWFAGGHVKGFQVGICSTFNGEYPPENERLVHLKIHPPAKGETSTQSMLVFGGIIIGSISTQPTSTVTTPGVEFLDASKSPGKKIREGESNGASVEAEGQRFRDNVLCHHDFWILGTSSRIYNVILDRIFEYMQRGC